MLVKDMKQGEIALVDMRNGNSDTPDYQWVLRTWTGNECHVNETSLVVIAGEDAGDTWDQIAFDYHKEKEIITKGTLRLPDVSAILKAK